MDRYTVDLHKEQASSQEKFQSLSKAAHSCQSHYTIFLFTGNNVVSLKGVYFGCAVQVTATWLTPVQTRQKHSVPEGELGSNGIPWRLSSKVSDRLLPHTVK